MRRLLQSEVVHLRDRSDDGLIGRSRLQRAAAVVAAGISIQTFANAIYDNGINPSGALELDGSDRLAVYTDWYGGHGADFRVGAFLGD